MSGGTWQVTTVSRQDMEIEVVGGASAGVAVLLGVDPGLFGPDRLPSGGVLKVVQMEDDQTDAQAASTAAATAISCLLPPKT